MPVTAAQLIAEITAETKGLEAGVAKSKALLADLADTVNDTSKGSSKSFAQNWNFMAESASQSMNKVNEYIEQASRNLDKFGNQARQMGTELSVAVTLPVAGLIKMGLQFDDVKKRATIAFTTMTGSAQQAQRFVADLQKYDLTTPTLFSKTLEGAQRLKMMGFAMRDIIPDIKAITDNLSNSPQGIGSFDRIIYAFGEMQAGGNLMERQLRMLTNDGVNAFQLLSHHMGISTEQLMKLTREGAIPATYAVKALLYEMEKQAPDGALKMLQTLQGSATNLMNFAEQTLGALFEPLYSGLVDTLNRSQTKLGAFKEEVSKWSDDIKKKWTAGFLSAAAIGPFLLAISGISKGLAFLLQPIGLVTVALAGMTYYMMTHKAAADQLMQFIKDHEVQVLTDLHRVMSDVVEIGGQFAPIFIASLPALTDFLHITATLLDLFTKLPGWVQATTVALIAFRGPVADVVGLLGKLPAAAAAVAVGWKVLVGAWETLALRAMYLSDAINLRLIPALANAAAKLTMSISEGTLGDLLMNGARGLAATLATLGTSIAGSAAVGVGLPVVGGAGALWGGLAIASEQNSASDSSAQMSGMFDPAPFIDKMAQIRGEIHKMEPGTEAYIKLLKQLNEVHAAYLHQSGHDKQATVKLGPGFEGGKVGDRVASKAVEAQMDGLAQKYVHMCQDLARTTVDSSTSMFRGLWDQSKDSSALSNLAKLKAMGLAHPYDANTTVAPGSMLYSETLNKQFGHVQIVGPQGQRLDQYGSNHFAASDFQYYVDPNEVAARRAAGGFKDNPNNLGKDPTDPGKFKGGEDAKAAAEIAKQFAKAYQEHSRNVDLYGTESEKAKMVWETQNGEYSKFSAAQKASLIALAEHQDALKKTADITKAYQGIIDDTTKKTADLNEAIILGNNNTKTAALAYDLAHQSMDGMTASQIASIKAHSAQEVAAQRNAEAMHALGQLWEDAATSKLPKLTQEVIQAVGGLHQWQQLTTGEQKKAFDLFTSNDQADKIENINEALRTLTLSTKSAGDAVLQSSVDLAGGWDEWNKLGAALQNTISLTEQYTQAMTAANALSDKYSGKADKPAFGRVSPTEDYNTARAKILSDANMSENDLNDPKNSQIKITLDQAGAQAAIATTNEASEIMKKWNQSLDLHIEEVRSKMTGAYDGARDAVEKWVQSNQDAVAMLEREGLSLDDIKKKVAESFKLDEAAKSFANISSMLGDLKKKSLELSATNPYQAWYDSLLQVDKTTGQLKLPDEFEALASLLPEIYATTEKIQEVEKLSTGITDAIMSGISDTFFAKTNTDVQNLKNSLITLTAKQNSYILLINQAKQNGDPNLAYYEAQQGLLNTQVQNLNKQIASTQNTLWNGFTKLFANIYKSFAKMLDDMALDMLKQKISGAVSGVLNKLFGTGAGSTDKTTQAAQALLLASTKEQVSATTLGTSAQALGTGAQTLSTSAQQLSGTSSQIGTSMSNASLSLSQSATALATAGSGLNGSSMQLDSSAQQLAMAAQELAASGGSGGGGGSSSGGATGAIFSSLPGFSGLMGLPGFATGGEVSAGQPIKVGEYGVEAFFPKTDGWIIPNRFMTRQNGSNFVGTNTAGQAMYSSPNTQGSITDNSSGDTNTHYHFNYAISTPDPNSFRRPQAATIADAKRVADRAQARG